MKKIAIILIAFVFAIPFVNTFAISSEPVTENTQALCSDGEDNDGNGVADLQDSNCSAFVPAPVVLENTQALCSDGEDNDGNGVADLQDSNCSAFVPAPVVLENTQALCSDGEDNDGNGVADLQDSNCSAFVPVPETPTTPTTPTVPTVTQTPIGPTGGSGGGSGFFGGSITSGTPISSTATSTNVDGINMACGNLFKTFMKKGNVNDKVEVIRLQAFLNKHLGTKLTVDGVFGSKTEAAVKQFQLKYKDSTLTPWGLTLPTGYVFKTTQRQLNLLVCPANDIPMPVLR